MLLYTRPARCSKKRKKFFLVILAVSTALIENTNTNTNNTNKPYFSNFSRGLNPTGESWLEKKLFGTNKAVESSLKH